jgi:hypothetical protein
MVSRGDGGPVGIALTATALFVSQPGAGGADARRIALAAGPADHGAWPELTAAFGALAPAGGGAEFAVALLPPLIEVTRLDLPPLDESALIQVLSRNAGRYFVRARGSQTIGVTQRRGRRGSPAVVLAAAAATGVVAAIDMAARACGCTVTTLAPAEAAWAAAAVAFWPTFARRVAHVLVHDEDRCVLLALEDGRLTNVRRFRSGAADAGLIADAIDSSGSDAAAVGAFGSVTGRQELLRALAARGLSVRPVPGTWSEQADTPALLAARFATASPGPLLMNEQARVARRAEVRRATIAVTAAAVFLLAVAAAVQLWGAHRQLSLVRAARAALHPEVAATLVGRSTVEDAYRRLAALAAAERTAPRWAPVLADLSNMLPDDAYLTAFRTRGDSLMVDGMAAHAARVFDAIHASELLAGVRAPAPVRREAPEGGDPLERFTIAATLRARAPAVDPVPGKSAPKPAGAQ